MLKLEREITQIFELVSADEIRTIVMKAITAPSGDNSQPWHFNWDGTSLEIFHDDFLAKHTLNNNNHASWLSLGTLIEIISHASNELNLDIKYDTCFETTAFIPAAVIKFTRKILVKSPLIPAIAKRCTDRRPFGKEKMPMALQQTLAHITYPDCRLVYKDSISAEVTEYLVRSDEYMWCNVSIAKDLFKWIKLTKKELTNCTDGMPWQNLGLKPADVPVFKLFRRFPKLIAFLWNKGFKKTANEMSHTALSNMAGLYCIAVSSTQPKALLNAGRLACRAWLELTNSEFGVQPLTIPALSIFDLETDKESPSMSKEFREHFLSGKKLLQQHFGFKNNEIPTWLFRTGKATPLPKELRTQRRPIDSVFSFSIQKRIEVSVVGFISPIDQPELLLPISIKQASLRGLRGSISEPMGHSTKMMRIMIFSEPLKNVELNGRIVWGNSTHQFGFEILEENSVWQNFILNKYDSEDFTFTPSKKTQ